MRWPVPGYSPAVRKTYVDAPAVVLFRYAPGEKLYEEPVYNSDVIWPDDRLVIRRAACTRMRRGAARPVPGNGCDRRQRTPSLRRH